MPKPVEDYYDEKKRRYLEDMRRAGESMTTGTPFDWEEVRGYTAELPDRSADDSAVEPVGDGVTQSAAESAGWRGWLTRVFGGRTESEPNPDEGR